MRGVVETYLRRNYPGARIVHELPLRYSTNRIDVAAITSAQIVAVEIKSSRDVSDRLEAQLRAFAPIASKLVIALAPVWNEALPPVAVTEKRKHRTWVTQTRRYTEAQSIIRAVKATCSHLETWTICQAKREIECTDRAYLLNVTPWAQALLDMLHVAELGEVIRAYRVPCSKERHLDMRDACARCLTGQEAVTAVCAALRARKAFDRASDPPIGSPAPGRPSNLFGAAP